MNEFELVDKIKDSLQREAQAKGCDEYPYMCGALGAMLSILIMLTRCGKADFAIKRWEREYGA